MSLENLLKIGQLREHPADRKEIRSLLDAARRNLADAAIAAVSRETRFDAAYKSIMQCALAAMMAHGYRPASDRPGHHQTMVQSLGLTIGLDTSRVVLLDTLRRKRNLSDYTGQDVDENSVTSCRDEAERLLRDLESWLKTNRPNLGAV